MQLREYKTSDCEQLARLFFQTVHSVNAKDYTKEQLDVCATGNVDLNGWDIGKFCYWKKDNNSFFDYSKSFL